MGATKGDTGSLGYSSCAKPFPGTSTQYQCQASGKSKT